MSIKLSKSQWELIGQKTGWLKIASNGEMSEELAEFLHGIVAKNAMHTPDKILRLFKNDSAIFNFLNDEQITDAKLLEFISAVLEENK